MMNGFFDLRVVGRKFDGDTLSHAQIVSFTVDSMYV